jgi:hypothetical protein
VKGFLQYAPVVLMLIACTPQLIRNQNDKALTFSHLESDYQVTDTRHPGCERMDQSALVHILETGEAVAERDIHDYYSIIGCEIQGSVAINGIPTTFRFDYGGIFRFANGMTFACGKNCCVPGFNYCSWDEDELKGQ